MNDIDILKTNYMNQKLILNRIQISNDHHLNHHHHHPALR